MIRPPESRWICSACGPIGADGRHGLLCRVVASSWAPWVLPVIVASLVGLAALLGGCSSGAQTVATDLETLDRPVATRCRLEWPQRPRPHVELVQLTGDELVDLVLIWRAAEAELEERIAYEAKLEAAARKCIE